MSPLLLCTDLDRTLIPNGKQPVSPNAKARFMDFVRRKEVTLVYVTGRHRELVEQAIMEFYLPRPDHVIADVGSTIYHVDDSGWRQSDEWDSQIAPDWHGLVHGDMCRLLSVFPALKMQEKEKQSRHKLSFYVPLDSGVERLISDIDVRLKHAGIMANIIWSIDEASGVGLLDVLPASANKLHAIHFLMKQQGYTHENTVFSGDSGNDLDVLMSDIRSVLVANADAETKSRVAKASQDTLYVAKGGYLGMNGNYCAGILEGVAHYIPEVDAWLREQN